MKVEVKRKRNILVAAAITLGANLLFFLMVFLVSRYDNISLDQLLYQKQTSISGTNSDFAASAVMTVGGLGTLAALLEMAAYWLLSGAAKSRLPAWKRYAKYCAGKTCRFFSRRALPLSLLLLLVACVSFAARLEVFSYVGQLRRSLAGEAHLPGAKAQPCVYLPGIHGEHLRPEWCL